MSRFLPAMPALRRVALAAIAAASTGAGAATVGIDLTGQSYVTYGDGNSYLLSSSGPLSVDSSPGKLADYVVVATGTNNGPVTTNYAGMDNAYATPTSGNGADATTNFFSTGTYADPGGANQFTGDSATTWDSTLAAMQGFLGGSTMTFFFNNNQINSGGSSAQSLAAWAQVWITDASGKIVGDVYQFTNQNSPYTVTGQTPANGGTLNGDPTTYTNTTVGNPLAGTNLNTDYVLAGGSIGGQSYNLGANQAAYAVIFPELNALMASLFGSGSDLSTYSMHVDVRLGCDPALNNSAAICRDDNAQWRSLNNGYEQLFIAGIPTASQIPEPATMLLGAFGLAGLAASRRRRAG